jgi:Undecaprenyl-phosphate glucose phosphotransferase
MIEANALLTPSWKAKTWLSEPVILSLVRASDCLTVALAGLAAYFARFDGALISGPELDALIVGVILVVNTFKFAGAYGDGTLSDVMKRTSRVYTGWTLVLLLTIFLGFVTKTAQEISRIWIMLWSICGFVALPLSRVALKQQMRRWQRSGFLTRSMVVVGNAPQCMRLIEQLKLANDPSSRLLGVFLLDDDRDERLMEIEGHRVLGGLQDLLSLARTARIDQVLVAMPGNAQHDLDSCVRHLCELPTEVCLLPAFGPIMPFRGVTQLGQLPLLRIVNKPLAGWGSVIKAIEDRVLGALILIMVSPIMLAIAVVIYLESGRPVIFRQKRYGFNNDVIEVLKFRTMRLGDESAGRFLVQARRDDERVTRSGKFLRRTSLDELPQFFNVLKGEMSIVGPRPHAVSHNEHYAQLIDSYTGRHRVKPGITGWAQVNGLRGETQTLDMMERRVKYDLYYIENWSFAFDLLIIVKTLWISFGDPNAY